MSIRLMPCGLASNAELMAADKPDCAKAGYLPIEVKFHPGRLTSFAVYG
jgi:hypothetical protein